MVEHPAGQGHAYFRGREPGRRALGGSDGRFPGWAANAHGWRQGGAGIVILTVDALSARRKLFEERVLVDFPVPDGGRGGRHNVGRAVVQRTPLVVREDTSVSHSKLLVNTAKVSKLERGGETMILIRRVVATADVLVVVHSSI